MLGDACDPGFGYDMVRLSALVTERTDPAQTGLAGSDHAEELAHLIDRLGARFGLRRVTRLVPQDTHIPEYAVMSVPAHGARHTAAAPIMEQDTLSAARPLRLFARPEPVDAIAQVPDGPPVQFSWRRMTHQVARVEGPERIAMEWWRDDRGNKLTRDYFRVESNAGARVWLYREGLYGRASANAAVVFARFVCVSLKHVCVCRFGRHDEFLVSPRCLESRGAGVTRQGAWPRRHRHR